MNCFGEKSDFAIEYELINGNEGYFDMWVGGKPLCRFIKNNQEIRYKWDLLPIVQWLEENMLNILEEKEFPLPVVATTAIEFYNLSGEFDMDDFDEFNKWFIKRQEWYFRHSWYVNRSGSFLADVLFHRFDNEKIEIVWDNFCLYPEVQFAYPKGIWYVDVAVFQAVVHEFISNFR